MSLTVDHKTTASQTIAAEIMDIAGALNRVFGFTDNEEKGIFGLGEDAKTLIFSNKFQNPYIFHTQALQHSIEKTFNLKTESIQKGQDTYKPIETSGFKIEDIMAIKAIKAALNKPEKVRKMREDYHNYFKYELDRLQGKTESEAKNSERVFKF